MLKEHSTSDLQKRKRQHMCRAFPGEGSKVLSVQKKPVEGMVGKS